MNYELWKQQLSKPEILALLSEGTIVTPFELIEEIVDKLPVQWDNPNLKFLDPVCGRGSFLFVIKNRLMQYHSEQHIVENMLYGMDISQQNVAFAKAVLNTENKYKDNIECGNSLEKEWNMKFDVVVGNPPYQSETTGNDPTSNRVSGKRNLYDKFLYMADSLAPTWAMIVPSFWLGRPNHKLHKDILSKCSEVMNTTSHFPNINGVTTCALIKKPKVPNTIRVVNGDVITEWPHSQVMGFVDSVIVTLLNKTKRNVMLDTIHFQSNEFIRSKIVEGSATPIVDITGPSSSPSPTYLISSIPLHQKHVGKPRLVLNWNGSKTGLGVVKVLDKPDAVISASCVALVCNSITERDNLLVVLNSKLFRFIVRMVKTSATNNKATFKHLPLVDLSRSWTDEELYAHFNLTKQEIDLIESTIK